MKFRAAKPYTLESHNTADVYYDTTNQTLGSVSPTTNAMLYCAAGVLLSYTLGWMRFLEYMGFVLVVFPLKCSFIIVQVLASIPGPFL